MTDSANGVLAPGTLFQGRYEIVRCIKAGGMGAVYECLHLQTRKRRALKIMLPQVLAKDDMRKRFELEARVTAEIDSEHIVETFDAGVDTATGAPFLVMELLRGEDLGVWLTNRGRLPAGQVVVLMHQAALALDKTHAAGVVHRDLKPENFFVSTRDDGSPRLKILDFGIAKVVADASQAAAATQALGTPLYMSPEQLTGDGAIDARADLYALGHIAFTLLTGRPYWDDEQKKAEGLFPFLHKVLAGAPEAPTVRAARWGIPLPPAFDAWFARASARSPAHRFQTASALAAELATTLGEVDWPPRPRLPSMVDERFTSSAFALAPGVLANVLGPVSTPGGAPSNPTPQPMTPSGPMAPLADANPRTPPLGYATATAFTSPTYATAQSQPSLQQQLSTTGNTEAVGGYPRVNAPTTSLPAPASQASQPSVPAPASLTPSQPVFAPLNTTGAPTTQIPPTPARSRAAVVIGIATMAGLLMGGLIYAASGSSAPATPVAGSSPVATISPAPPGPSTVPEPVKPPDPPAPPASAAATAAPTETTEPAKPQDTVEPSALPTSAPTAAATSNPHVTKRSRNCTPPYFTDAAGHRQYKRECL